MYYASAGRRVRSSGGVCSRLGLWVQLLQSQILEVNLTCLTRICNHHFWKVCQRFQNVVTARVFIYCVLPKENQERCLLGCFTAVGSVSTWSEKNLRSNCLCEFKWDSALLLSHCIQEGLATLRLDLFCHKFLFFVMFTSTYHKPRQGLLAHL